MCKKINRFGVLGFRYYDLIAGPKTLYIAVTQSGETADTLVGIRRTRIREGRQQYPRSSRPFCVGLVLRAGPPMGVLMMLMLLLHPLRD